MKYNLIVVGAGPAGLMTARTAARDGLKVLLLDQRKEISNVRRFCSQLIRTGDSGFSSAKKPTDIKVQPVTVTFEINEQNHRFHLNHLEEDLTVDYSGPLRCYHNESWVSPSGHYFNTLKSSEHIYGFQLDKEMLLEGLVEECVTAGCEVRSGTKCIDVEETSEGVSAKVRFDGKEETLTASHIVLADGAFSPLMEKLGFNQGSSDLGPQIKLLGYILDRVDSPFPESRHLELSAPSIYPGEVPLGLWVQDNFQLVMAAPNFVKMNLPDLLKRFMNESPFASWFASSKIVDRIGCNMSLRSPTWEPAHGKVICCGDNAAFAEAAIKGAFGCGYNAAKAIKTNLEGGDGNTKFNKFWQGAFYFHSPQYRGRSKEVYPPARVLDDNEIDTLYKWINGNNLCGLPGDILLDNAGQLKEELPGIAEKVFP
jgi:digeranylgeranylglycerophospholipid reductase